MTPWTSFGLEGSQTVPAGQSPDKKTGIKSVQTPLPIDGAEAAAAEVRVEQPERSSRLHDVAEIQIRGRAPRPDVPRRHSVMCRQSKREKCIGARDVFRS